METLYKVLDENNCSMHGGSAVWTPGVWMPAVTGPLVPCQNGYHLCRAGDLLNWLGPAIWRAEYQGERIDCDPPETPPHETKVVVRQAQVVERLATWNERTARLFACDCAERVLPLFERQYPDDPRPRQAIDTARRFAKGQASKDERFAAWAAASAAAWNAAWDAARDAAREAAGDAASAAASAAAWDAASAAAWDAAGDAAWDAAWDAERAWQTARLFDYLEGRAG